MYQRMLVSVVALGVLGVVGGATAGGAMAARLPEIQASQSNQAPACATPGRLMAFIGEKNSAIAPQFRDISLHYMRIGQELGVRWDYAVYQMLVETGFLTYTGDVNVRQNNFAGIGATGGGVPGESFPTVAEGVRAHIQHLMLYAGMPIANPVAERTRKVQSWGIMAKWQRSLGGPVRYDQMTSKWAPNDRGYPRNLLAVHDRFMKGACRRADPEPELIAGIRATGNQQSQTVAIVAPDATRTLRPTAPVNSVRSGLGAPLPPSTNRGSVIAPDNSASTGTFAVLNSNASTATQSPVATDGVETTESQTTVGRFASNLMAAITPSGLQSPPDPASCRVWTASYGGQRALIIKSMSASHVNYTVLDVNTGREQREADAYIAAYAKGGKTIAEFGDPQQALDKAFKLCPTGNKQG